MDKPYIYMAFAATPHNDQRPLHSLKREETDIEHSLLREKAAGRLDYNAWKDVTAQKLIDTLPLFTDKLSIFHFAGHADSVNEQEGKLVFSDDDYSTKQLAKILAGAPNLKLVFLNGCSTLGFVEELHALGVNAVLATTETIGDKHAANFAINFYQTLVLPDKTLQEAFDVAATGLGSHNTSVNIHYRSGRRRFRNSSGKLPWGLYVNTNPPNEDEEDILQWPLVKKQGEVEPMSASMKKSLAELSVLEEENQSHREEIHKKLKEIEGLRESIEKLPDQKELFESLVEGIKSKVEEAQQSIKENKKKKEILRKKIVKKSQGKWDNTIKEKILEHLENLNFRPQQKAFRKAIGPQGPHAFIVRGTPACGHEILIKRLLVLENVDYTSNNQNKIVISFDKLTQDSDTKDNIWLEVKRYRSLDRADDPREIFNALVDSCFVANLVIPLVFIFRGLYDCPDANLTRIQEFWQKFQTFFAEWQLKKQDSPGSQPLKVYLFVLDKNCDAGTNLKAEKDPEYEQLISEKQLDQLRTTLLPSIKTVGEDDLDIWFNSTSVPNEIYEKEEDLINFITEKKQAVLPTLQYICTATGHEDIFEKLKQGYGIQFPTKNTTS